MKTLSQFIEDLSNKESVLGFNPFHIAQGSPEWSTCRLGVQSASNAKTILMKNSSLTKQTYIAQLVAQVCTKEAPQISAKALDWGNMNEDKARAVYEFEAGVKVTELPFVYKDESMRVGCSPDGLIFNDKEVLVHGVEIKAPLNSENYIKFLCNNTIKKEHELQCQFSMWVTGCDTWHYGNYDPRMSKKQLHWYVYERNDEAIKLFEEATQEISEQMDKMLGQIGLQWGSQWS